MHRQRNLGIATHFHKQDFHQVRSSLHIALHRASVAPIALHRRANSKVDRQGCRKRLENRRLGTHSPRAVSAAFQSSRRLDDESTSACRQLVQGEFQSLLTWQVRMRQRASEPSFGSEPKGSLALLSVAWTRTADPPQYSFR